MNRAPHLSNNYSNEIHTEIYITTKKVFHKIRYNLKKITFRKWEFKNTCRITLINENLQVFLNFHFLNVKFFKLYKYTHKYKNVSVSFIHKYGRYVYISIDMPM